MNRNRVVLLTVGGLFVVGVALATTYLCLEHFIRSRRDVSAGIIDTGSLIQKINLSKEQKEKLDPMEASLKKDIEKVQVELAQERMALCELLGKDESDPKKLDDYVNRVAALEGQQQRLVVQHLMAMRSVLNPEQKKTLFSSLMQAICKGCRATVPHQKCICGMCDAHAG